MTWIVEIPLNSKQNVTYLQFGTLPCLGSHFSQGQLNQIICETYIYVNRDVKRQLVWVYVKLNLKNI